MAASPAVIAATVVGLARDGRFTEIADLFAPRLRAAVSAETLQVTWTSELSSNGPVAAVGQPVTTPGEPGLTRVSVPVTCEHGHLTVVMSVDDAGLLNGLRLASAATTSWTPPPYADPSGFLELEVVLGSGPLAVPGTLTLSGTTPGPHPGVVLLGGGGPFDRDETSGPNKPLKDLAWGLACRGVAVLRFDKVTHVHSQVMSAPGFTMSEEYVPHAVAAVRMLREQPAVDAGRVFVLGHSMGGKVAPRVATAEPSVAGLVILAGDTQPMHRAAVRVARYLASVDPAAMSGEAVATLERQAERVDNLGSSTGDLPFGFPASYWRDLRDYDPVPLAAALPGPILVLQGGRDYQVTVEDDLARWRAGLAHRPDVTIRVHEADNHLFFPGEGPSTPAEYLLPQHVDPAVVTDVADWLTSGPDGVRAVR
jgi:hypothetical protein